MTDAWQDARESTPRKGERVLVWVRLIPVGEVRLCTFGNIFGKPHWFADGGGHMGYVTHWQPVPAGPVEEGGKDE